MTNPSENDFVLSFFPQTKKLYRIDWLGDVCYPDKRASHRQPSIAVALTEVVRTNAGYEKAAPKQRQIQRFSPVGLLSLLQIGDIWQAGRRIDCLPAARTEFQNLRIDKDSTRIVKAGVKLKDTGFLIPFSAYTGHSLHTQSYCLLTQLSDSKSLVIPCAELIRFYFGSSSKLLARLFTTPLRRASLYKTDTLGFRSGRLVLELGPDISGYSAADIGRIARSSDAWHAAVSIGKSLLQGSTRGKLAYPYTHFPFTGTTDLVVTGEWLPHGKRAKQNFLVHRIESCSHPFPFRTLQYRMSHSSSVPSKLPQEEASSQLAMSTVQKSQRSKPSSLIKTRRGNCVRSSSQQTNAPDFRIWNQKRFSGCGSPPSPCLTTAAAMHADRKLLQLVLQMPQGPVAQFDRLRYWSETYPQTLRMRRSSCATY